MELLSVKARGRMSPTQTQPNLKLQMKRGVRQRPARSTHTDGLSFRQDFAAKPVFAEIFHFPREFRALCNSYQLTTTMKVLSGHATRSTIGERVAWPESTVPPLPPQSGRGGIAESGYRTGLEPSAKTLFRTRPSTWRCSSLPRKAQRCCGVLDHGARRVAASPWAVIELAVI